MHPDGCDAGSRWLTVEQAAGKGWRVIGGEVGTTIERGRRVIRGKGGAAVGAAVGAVGMGAGESGNKLLLRRRTARILFNVEQLLRP